MARKGGATARLRRTFHYPDEDDDDSINKHGEMDEQEQEALIASLAADNAARNATFRNSLLALTFAAALPYIAALFLRRNPRSVLLSLLSLTSLLSTAFLLHRLPPDATGLAPLDAWARKEDVHAATKVAAARLKRETQRLVGGVGGAKSPLEEYLPYLNLGLVIIVSLMGQVADAKGRAIGVGWAGWTGMANWPALVYFLVLAAKVVMGGVDPERELSALKYGYKGA